MTLRRKPEPHPYLQTIPPYPPGRPIAAVAREFGLDPTAIVKLASNENPLGSPPQAVAAIAAAMNSVNRYPDFDSFDLYTALSKQLDLPKSAIAIGCGSSELIQLVVRAYAGEGDKIVMPRYSFASYTGAARAVGAEIVEVANAGWQPDLEATIAAIDDRVRIVFLASPNNPTGVLTPASALLQFVDAIPDDVVLVLDEAYRDYVAEDARPDCRALVARRHNILVLRTFSKVYGLAGLRVGYGFGDEELIGMLRRLIPPFSVNALAQTAALAALGDQAFLERSIELNRRERTRLEATFATRGFDYVPSEGNFVLLHVGDGAGAFQALMRSGVIVRPLANYDLEEWIRVSVGLPEENNVFLKCLEKMYPQGSRAV